MIRCYPVDGSAPFEVADHGGATLRLPKIGYTRIIGCSAAAELPDADERVLEVGGVLCRIESWRERAERLETEAPRFAWDETWDFNRKGGHLGTLATVYVYRRDHRFQPDTPRDQPTRYAPGAKDMSGVLRNPADPRGDLEYATEDEAKRAAEAMVMLAMRTEPT